MGSDTTVADQTNFEFNMAGTSGGECFIERLVVLHGQSNRVSRCLHFSLYNMRALAYPRPFSIGKCTLLGAFAAERGSLTIDTGRGQASFANNTAVLGDGGNYLHPVVLLIAAHSAHFGGPVVEYGLHRGHYSHPGGGRADPYCGTHCRCSF